METRGGILLSVGGCLLFALGWLLGGGMSISRGEPARAESRAAADEIQKLKKQVVNLQSQQTRLARELDETQTSQRTIRRLKDDIEALQAEVTKLKQAPRNPLSGPMGVIKDIANVVTGTPSPSPEPTPTPE
jgi:chromosome segregation ATPase